MSPRKMIARGRLSLTKEVAGGMRATVAQASAASAGYRCRGADCEKDPRPGSLSAATAAGFRANGKYLLPEGRACRREAVVRRIPEA